MIALSIMHLRLLEGDQLLCIRTRTSLSHNELIVRSTWYGALHLYSGLYPHSAELATSRDVGSHENL